MPHDGDYRLPEYAHGYALHDRDFYLEFVLGMWFNTRATHGLPTREEFDDMLREWPAVRRDHLYGRMAARGQVK